MHPIERLRSVARVTGADPNLLVAEMAAALAGVLRVEAAGLVPACRRLIARHLTTGPVWWLAARVVTAADPVAAAWAAAAEVEEDATATVLAAALPEDATVTIIGWPDLTAAALRSRGDLEVLVADALGEGAALSRLLSAGGADSAAIPDAGIAGAVMVSDLVVVEAMAGGPSGILANTGSHAAAAVAAHRGIPVWAVAGIGRVLPAPLWDALLRRVDERATEPWDRPVELVPAALLVELIGPSGRAAAGDGLVSSTCPTAPELLRPAT